MNENQPDVVELAKRQRHFYLLRKVKQGKLLSVKEIGELEYYERRRQNQTRKRQR